MKKHVLALALFLFGGALAAFAQTATESDASASEKEPADFLMTMNRDARCGQVLVNCLVNGQPMRMMLDTGATHTVLHDESAATLKNVRWVDTSNMPLRGNSSQRPKMLIAEMRVGPGVSPQHPVIVVSLAAVRSMMAEKIDGIVGMDILGSLPFTFDLRGKEFFWGVPAVEKIVPLNGKHDANGRIFLQVKSGEKEFPLLLDTGSSVTRICASNWAPGAAGSVTAQIGDVDNAGKQQMTAGNAGRLEVAPGVFLKTFTPLLCGENELTMLGMDALEDSVLVHLPTENSPFGVFFLVP